MKFFCAVTFGSQTWSFICWWNGKKLLHGLYSDFDAYVSHKNELHLTVSVLRFVFWLRGVKYIFLVCGFILDCSNALKAIKFFSRCINRNWSSNWLFLLNRVQNHNCFHSRGGSKTATTPKVELFVIIIYIF